MVIDKITIRDAAPEDIAAVAELVTELGYPTSDTDMQIRFQRISVHPDYKTIIAVLDEQIVGMAGLAKGIFYEKNDAYLRIVAFVVKSKNRKQGIGRRLLKASEDWAITQNCFTILINSGNRDERKVSHDFYRELGYTVKSSGFVKELER